MGVSIQLGIPALNAANLENLITQFHFLTRGLDARPQPALGARYSLTEYAAGSCRDAQS